MEISATWSEIEKLFNDVGKSLKDYKSMPFPDDSFMHELDNRLLSDELSYNKELEHEEHEKLYRTLNKEQLHAYASIIDNVENSKRGVFFVYGSGGCGKTFLWNTICCKLCSVKKVILLIASSGIAATLLPEGRTTHSRMKLGCWNQACLRDTMTSLDPERASLPFGEFSKWVLDVGNGTLPNVNPDDIISDSEVVIPDKFLIRARENPLKAVVDVPGNEHSYFSQDSLVDSEGEKNDFGYAFPIEYLNSINLPCLPKHHLKIKEGCMIILMRNLNQIMGLLMEQE
ncbi:uncharacterized protein LOC141680211 [Apium graveolens]|uniref:uncharacterized protein LOC141680211 n=1 Tax=Apium graveolens TaxID=4045 RepID=UPI003D7A934D